MEIFIINTIFITTNNMNYKQWLYRSVPPKSINCENMQQPITKLKYLQFNEMYSFLAEQLYQS